MKEMEEMEEIEEMEDMREKILSLEERVINLQEKNRFLIN